MRWPGLYAQVLVAVALGVGVGWAWPAAGAALEPLGTGFVQVVKVLVVPIVFATIVTGIAKVGDVARVGRVGLEAIVYFEVLTTAALAIGLVVGEVLRPGERMYADPATLDVHQLDAYTSAAHAGSGFLLASLAKNTMLQVVAFSVVFGLVLARLGERGRAAAALCDRLLHGLFRVLAIVMRFAPLGAFGAMAFVVGKFGLKTLVGLGELVAAFYVTAALFVVVVLGAVARACGFSILRLLGYLKDEIFLVLGTSSSESALPTLMAKLEQAGCPESVVGLVVPLGYSFNLDGTSIYLTLATLFVAQATRTPLTLGDELGLLGVLLVTSKGAAAVTGGGFITLAATLSSSGKIPVAGLVVLLGVDRFLSEARAITNLIGNAVATLAISRWEGVLDDERAAVVR